MNNKPPADNAYDYLNDVYANHPDLKEELERRASAKGLELGRILLKRKDLPPDLYAPLPPKDIVKHITVERMHEAINVLLEVDLLSDGQWTEIEALRTAHAGLIVLLTLAEIAQEEQTKEDK